MNNQLDLSAIPVAAIVAVVVLVLVQLSLQIAAIVSLVRTPQTRVTIGGRKWVWALIIILGEIVGPILWFVLGRTAAQVQDVAVVSSAEDRAQAADALYGPPESKQ